MESLYGSVDDLEFFVGEMLEAPQPGNSFNPVVTKEILTTALLLFRADRWSIMNFDTIDRDSDWQKHLVEAAYS